MSLKATHIDIQNVFGVDHLEFDPNSVTVIEGPNDAGKTSVLKALQALYAGGGWEDQALRKGERKGGVSIVFEDDEGVEITVEMSLTEKGTYYKIDHPDPDVTARSFIEGLKDQFAHNPIEILSARPKDRGQIMLEAIPMTVDTDAIQRLIQQYTNLTGDNIIVDNLESRHALEVLGNKKEGLIHQVYSARQSRHSIIRDKEGVINDLQEGIVEDLGNPDELADQVQELRDEIEDLQGRMSDQIEGTRTQAMEKTSSLKEERDAKIREIEKEYSEKIGAVENKASREIETIRSEFSDAISEKKAEVKGLEATRDHAIEQENTTQTILKTKAELSEKKAVYDGLTEIIEELRSMRTSFRGNLPAGITVGSDGEIYDDEGVAFEHWNKQRQVQFAGRIAVERTGDLKLIPIDGIESLVGDKYEAFLEWADAIDAQWVLTRAVDTDQLIISHPKQNGEG